jgi:hypothetical protein
MILWLLAGCSGYRFTQQENPLSQYGIQSLSVPMFYNYSNLGDVSGDFTRETYRLLTGFSGLKLVSGYSSSADAVMIGIVKSAEKLNESLVPYNPRVAKSQAAEAIGKKREDFYIPGTTNVRLGLQVIIIKKPTEEEVALLRSGIGDQVRLTSKIIFNEFIPIEMQYQREVFNKPAVDVVATQNFGIQRKTIEAMAEQTAQAVKDMILYAF